MQFINKVFIALFFTSAAAMAPRCCHAQNGQIYLGIAPGVNFVKYTTSAFSIPNTDPAAILQKGSGVAPLLGISLQSFLDIDDWDNKNFLVLEAYYDSKSAKFSNSGSDMTASISYVLLNMGYKYNFVGAPAPFGPGLQLTAYMGYRIMSNFHSDANNFTTAIDGAKTLRFGLRGQLVYDIPVTYDPHWLVISPFVGYDFPFTKVDNTDRSWLASSIYAGIVFRFLIAEYPIGLQCY